jgi:hypothetical protein
MANESYITNGTALLINGEVGADYAFSAEGVATLAGRVSAQIDLGAAPRPYIYDWSCELQLQATPAIGETVDIYIAGAPDSDATQIDAAVGASDAALTQAAVEDAIQNLHYIGSVTSENAAASEVLVASGTFTHYKRYVSIVVHNTTAAAINATDSNFRFDLTPKAFQGQ